jgi:predicted dehydrogenase
MPPLRVGLIGASRIVPAHLRGYAALRAAGFDDFRITAICSRDPARARSLVAAPSNDGPAVDQTFAPTIPISDFQDDAEVRIFTDVREMLDAGVVDAVDITTEVGLHHTQALACLEAGVHALVEKPLAITVRAARQMRDAADQRGLSLAVCENARFNRTVRIAKWLVDRGDLGTPQMASWVQLGTPKWSPNRWVGNSSWRHVKMIGAGGASLDVGPHLFHRLRMLCGEVESVAAFARVFEPTRYLEDDDGRVLDTVACDADDAFMALATFETGAIGQLSFSFAGHGEMLPPVGPVLYGTKGGIQGETVRLDGQQPTTLDEHFAQHGAADAERLFPRGMSDAFGLLIGDWLRSIREQRPAETSGTEGLHDLAASFAIVEASAAGRAVRLSEVIDGTVDGYQRELDEHYGLR